MLMISHPVNISCQSSLTPTSAVVSPDKGRKEKKRMRKMKCERKRNESLSKKDLSRYLAPV